MSLLEGVKVLDFTHAYAGPYCTMNLADFGAEVIKIERCDHGDQARLWGPFKNNYSGYYSSFNRGKKSLSLNIASPEGKEIIFDLVKKADIVCSNFKAGTLERFGMGYEQMKEIKPDIIYASISGFGTKGEFSKFAAYDNVIQALAGVMDLTGFPDKTPTKVGPAIGDSYSGLMLLLGIVLAYYHKLNTGLGQKVEATMLGSLYTMAEYPILEYANSGKKITRMGNNNPYYAPADAYKCSDGYMAISIKNDSMWKDFCNALGMREFINSPLFMNNELRIKNKTLLKEIIEVKLSSKTRADIESLLNQANIPAAGVISIVEALEDPQLKARNMVIDVDDPGVGSIKLVGNPIKLSKNTPILNIPSPLLGQDTDSILNKLGYSAANIEELRKNNVV